MTQRLQIILGLSLIILFVLLVNQIRKEKLELRYSLPWMALLGGLFVIDLCPGITDWLAGIMGIALPINMLMLLGLGFSVVVIFSLTAMLAKEVNKQKQLTQELGLLKKRADDMEKVIKEMQGEGKDR